MRPDEVLEFTMRTDRGRALLRPTPELVACILGVIARCLTLYPVELYAFVFMSNHAHLLARVRNACAAASFIGYLKRNTTKAIRRCTGWPADVWDEGGEPVPVLDDGAAIRRVRYIHSNGVKEGLVASPLDWPGATSARAFVSNMRIETAPYKPRPRNVRAGTHERWLAAAGTPQVIALQSLPALREMPPNKRRALHTRLIADIVAEGHALRGGAEPVGAARLLDIDPFAPIELDETPPPLAHFTLPERFDEYLAQRAAFDHACRIGSRVHRSTDVITPLPPGAFVPALGFRDV